MSPGNNRCATPPHDTLLRGYKHCIKTTQTYDAIRASGLNHQYAIWRPPLDAAIWGPLTVKYHHWMKSTNPHINMLPNRAIDGSNAKYNANTKCAQNKYFCFIKLDPDKRLNDKLMPINPGPRFANVQLPGLHKKTHFHHAWHTCKTVVACHRRIHQKLNATARWNN